MINLISTTGSITISLISLLFCYRITITKSSFLSFKDLYMRGITLYFKDEVISKEQ